MLDLNSTPLVVSKDRTPVNQGVLFTAVAQAMYSDYYWPQLSEALHAAQGGDGKGLLQLYDDYYQRKQTAHTATSLKHSLQFHVLMTRVLPALKKLILTLKNSLRLHHDLVATSPTAIRVLYGQ